MVSIGDLVAGRIVRARPDYNAYLVLLHDSSDFAILPKENATGPLKIKDAVSAAVYARGERYPILSQRCAHYFRKMAESVFRPAIEQAGIRIHRVASVEHAAFVKIAVSHPSGEDPIAPCLPFVRTYHDRTGMTVSLVRYTKDLHEYVKAALSPAPLRSIRRVEVYPQEKRALVVVEHGSVALFLGPRGANVSSASKLTDIHIVPIDERQVEAGQDVASSGHHGLSI